MAYRRNQNVPKKKLPDGYSANQVSSRDQAENSTRQREIAHKDLELAEVVSVIRDSSHPDYTANEDLGKAKVRRVISEFDRDESSLGYVRPLKARFKDYPIEHELVVVVELNGTPFYIQTGNWRGNVNQNTAPKFSVNKIERSSGAAEDYSAASAGIAQSAADEINPEKDRFETSTKIKPLRHRAGDTIVEGRFGNSIRLSRDEDMRPYIQLRVGQRSGVESANFLDPFFEDVNKDPTSIYLMDEGTTFPLGPDSVSAELEPTTVDFEDHLFSAENTPDGYNDAQVLVATNRIVMNAKERQIMGFAKKDINWTTLANFTVDVKKRMKTLSKQGHLHISESYFDVLPEGNIHLATEDENEPVARGQQTHDRFVKTLQTLQIETHPTPCGPSGPPNQASTYAQIEQKVRDTVRSEKIFVDNVGEKVKRSMSPASE